MRYQYFIAAFLAIALNLACQTASVKSLSEINSTSNAAVEQTMQTSLQKVGSNPIKVMQPIKSNDKRRFDEMFDNVVERSNYSDNKSFNELTEASKKLNEAVNEKPAGKTYLAKKALDKVIQICDDENSTASINDMKLLKSLSNILADFQSVEALDVLIECSDRRSSMGGLSYFEYETVPAIVKFQERAFPYLERKLLSDAINSQVKCNIISILGDKRDLEVKKILMNARKTETKQMAKYCIEKALR